MTDGATTVTDVADPTPPADPPPADPPKKDDPPEDKRTETQKTFAAGVNEGKAKQMKQLAKQLGLESVSVDDLKAALQARQEAEDAKKTNEERLAEANTQISSMKEAQEAALDILKARAKQDLENLDETLKSFVIEQAGDDPMKQMKVMTSESFAKLQDKIGALGRSPGTPAAGEPTGGDNSNIEEARALYDKALAGDAVAKRKYLDWSARNPGLAAKI